MGRSAGRGKDGSGVLATITFQAVASGTSPLTFTPPPATNLGLLPFTSTNGSVTVDSSTTNVRVVPDIKNVTVGDTFTVDVVADYVVNSGSFQFKLDFDPARLAYKSLAGGTYLGDGPRGDPDRSGPGFRRGHLRRNLHRRRQGRPDRRTVRLATITFQALAPGTASNLDPLGRDPDDGRRGLAGRVCL